MTATRRKIVKLDESKPTFAIEDGEVRKIPKPVLAQHEVSEDVEVGSAPTWRIETPNGEARYEYVGNCQDCTWEKKEMPVFRCTTYPIRNDAELGDQLAAFWNDGGSKATPLCQKHYRVRTGQQPKPAEATYKVIEDRKFV